jgi:thymidylate synthase ThyX
MTTISARIVADSISPGDVRLTTLELRYPRFFHAELMTHRAFARNASSSRAIPTRTMQRMIREDPAMPLHLGKTQKGMQAKEEITDARERRTVYALSKHALRVALQCSKDMVELCGLHKQIANRITEPWQHMNVVVSATDWHNFFALRCHPDAQPHFRALAWTIADVYFGSTPAPVAVGDWHLPYLDADALTLDLDLQKKVSAARCARVSYKLFDGSKPNVDGDVELYDRLLAGLHTGGGEPGHMSPLEHQATPLQDPTERSGPFRGWLQHRKEISGENMTFDYEAAVAKGWRDDALGILDYEMPPLI